MIEPCVWPNPGDTGRYVIGCSCGWSAVGTVYEINGYARTHDDSPWGNHIVTIRGRVCAATDPAWPQVRTQMSASKGHPVRYGYVITEQDGSSFVSPYLFSTEDAAQRAGEKDADACRAGL